MKFIFWIVFSFPIFLIISNFFETGVWLFPTVNIVVALIGLFGLFLFGQKS